VEVTAQSGGTATIVNTLAGDQNIAIAGAGSSAGLDVRTQSGGGFASISNNVTGASQNVAVTDADHISVGGSGGGSASIMAFGGTQTLSITGSGANAINFGSTGAKGASYLIGTNQFVTAGQGGGAGSITVIGSDSNGAFAGISSQPSGSPGVQTISTSGTLSVAGGNATGQVPGSAAGIYDNTFGTQMVSANRVLLQGGSVGSGNGAIIIAVNGSQQVNAGAGGMTLTGGAGGTNNGIGIFQNRADPALTQSIAVSDGGSLTLRGGGGGTSNGAFINSAGSQQVSAGAGDITIMGGAGGTGNQAGIFQTGAGNQAITAQGMALQGGSAGAGNSAQIGANTGTQQVNSGSIFVTGGSGGTNNAAQLRSSIGLQTIVADEVSLRGGAGGTSNFAVIVAPQQVVTVHGDLSLTGGASLATPTAGGGALLGGGGLAPTNLALTVGGNVTLNGGSAVASGSTIGVNNVGGRRTDITMNVGGNVTLNPGAASGTRIGSPATNLAGGEIVVNAGGAIALNSAAPDNASAIRTADSVWLQAREISQGADSTIQANALEVSTSQGASLAGTNAVNALYATNTGGPFSFNNVSTLLTVRNVLGYAGPVAISQAGDLRVNGSVSSGPQTINVTGGLTVMNDQPYGSASLSANGAQSINARSVEVTAQNAGSASINNFGTPATGGSQSINAHSVAVTAQDAGSASISNGGGTQVISVAGGGSSPGLDVRTLSGGGTASISNNGTTQSIIVTDADHINVNGASSGDASIATFSGNQVISITGSGANAINLGSVGAQGSSHFIAVNQSIVAGAPGQAGSISIVGSANSRPASILTLQGSGNTQAVSTSGLLSVTGGTALAQTFGAGMFHNGTGPQTVNAAGILVQGGSVGSGNGAFINSAGSQQVNAGAGGITIVGGAGVTGDQAGIFQNGTGLQAITAQGIVLQGGSSGSGNSAIIGANNGSQTINAGSGGITMIGGSSTGLNNFALINQASSNPAFAQTVHSAGSMLLDSGDAGERNFALIQAFGGLQNIDAGQTTLRSGAGGVANFAAIQAQKQEIDVHGDLSLMAGGSVASATAGGGAGIGGRGGATPTATNLSLAVDGNLTLTGGSVAGTGASIGAPPLSNDPTVMSISAGGNVVLNPGTAPGALARLGARAESPAGGNIDISANGSVVLNSTSPDMYSFIRTADGVTLRAREIAQGVDSRIQANTLSIETQQGASLVGANVLNSLSAANSTGGAVSFNNTSPLLTVTGIQQIPSGALTLNQTGNLLVTGDVSSGAQAMRATGDFTIAPQAASGLQVHANGAQTFSAGGKFSLLGGSAWDGYALVTSTGPMRVQTGGDLSIAGGSGLLATAMLYGKDDVRLTVGDALRLDRGTGLLAFARVQADFGDKIYVEFPNRSSGGYFVDGVEGVTNRGLDGFFTGLLPAVRGRSLILTYGQ
jgi:hypothetical protein